MLLILLFSALSVFVDGSLIGGEDAGLRASYKIYCEGNCDRDIVTQNTVPGVVLMGGGTDTNEAFAWQIQNADKGDFVVLRTSGDDAYNDYIMEMSVALGSKLNSVTTILFNSAKGSQESEVLDTLRAAEAIFLAGGDQAEYLDYWANTDVQTIIQEKSANITVGGTSAGCAVLGQWVYSAEKGSIYSDEALENPYNKYLTIAPAFLTLPYLDSIITDTHFVTRDRMGRMLTFMARILTDSEITKSDPPPAVVRGMGVDEHTALLLDVKKGALTAVGVGTAYICGNTPSSSTTSSTPSAYGASLIICEKDTPLTFTEISCERLSGLSGDTFSMTRFSGSGTQYTSKVLDGVIANPPYGPILAF